MKTIFDEFLINSPQNYDRILYQRKLNRMFESNFKRDVFEIVKAQFPSSDLRLERLEKVVSTSRNTFKKAIDLKTIFYCDESFRIFENENQTRNKTLSDFYEDANADGVFLRVEEILNSVGTAFIFVFVNLKEELEMRAINPEFVCAEYDENATEKINAISYTNILKENEMLGEAFEI